MKLVVVSDHIPMVGGVGRASFEPLPHLAQKGIKVSMVCKGRTQRSLKPSKVLLYPIRTRKTLLPFERWLFGYRAFKMLRDIQDYDIVHMHAPYSAFIKRGKEIDAPIVLTLHSHLAPYAARLSFLNTPIPKKFHRGFLGFIGSLLNRTTLSEEWADHFIAPTKSASETFTEYAHIPQEKITVIPHGVDTAKFAPDKKDYSVKELFGKADDRYVLTVGTLGIRKGTSDLLKAFRFVKSQYRDNLKLVAVGGFEHLLRRKIYRMLSDLRIADDFVHLSGLDEELLAKLYATCDVFVLPTYAEVFGYPVVEAMASGAIVVTTNAVGVRDHVISGENGYIVRMGDWRSLAKQMLDCLRSVDKQEEIRVRARKTAEETYDIRIIAKLLEYLYKQLS